MRARYLLIVAVTMITAAPILACPPPLPGQTEEQRLRPMFDASTDIVYGVVERGAKAGRLAHFRVIHVYKGNLTPGSVIQAAPTLGFDPPSCLGGTIPAPQPQAIKGQYGVVAFNDRAPALNFINSYTLDLMFEQGWIRRASR